MKRMKKLFMLVFLLGVVEGYVVVGGEIGVFVELFYFDFVVFV